MKYWRWYPGISSTCLYVLYELWRNSWWRSLKFGSHNSKESVRSLNTYLLLWKYPAPKTYASLKLITNLFVVSVCKPSLCNNGLHVSLLQNQWVLYGFLLEFYCYRAWITSCCIASGAFYRRMWRNANKTPPVNCSNVEEHLLNHEMYDNCHKNSQASVGNIVSASLSKCRNSVVFKRLLLWLNLSNSAGFILLKYQFFMYICINIF